MAVTDELEGPAGEPAGAEAEPFAETAAAPPAAAAEPDEETIGRLKGVLEALVFVHRGVLPPRTVREVLGDEFGAEQIAAAFAALKQDYEERGGAVVLLEVAGGYQFGTRPELAPWIQKLDFYEHHRHLSRPTLETLAIIAYKQPVTRAEIEAIRGVNVERIVRTLIERKLVRILGHKDVPGKPMVLGTTKEFLELFGLSSLAALPPLKDFIEPPSDAGVDEELPLPFPEAGGQEGAAEAGDAREQPEAGRPEEGAGDAREHGQEEGRGEREAAGDGDGGDAEEPDAEEG